MTGDQDQNWDEYSDMISKADQAFVAIRETFIKHWSNVYKTFISEGVDPYAAVELTKNYMDRIMDTMNMFGGTSSAEE